jgi:hypothetical protein
MVCRYVHMHTYNSAAVASLTANQRSATAAQGLLKKSKPRAVPRSCTCMPAWRNEPRIPHGEPPVSLGGVNSHLGNLCVRVRVRVCVCAGGIGLPRRPGIRDSPALCTVPGKARPGIRKGGRIWCQIAQHHGGATPCAPSIRPGDLPILPLACTGQSCWERHAAGGGALV